MMENSVLQSLKQRHMWGGVPFHPNSHFDAANNALELLRLNIQEHFSKEVLAILAKFRENYFIPAMKNIKENLGEHSITEEQIHRVCVALLSGASDFLETKWNEAEENVQLDCTGPADFTGKHSGSKGSYRKRKESEIDSLTSQKRQNISSSDIRTPKNPKIDTDFVIESQACKVFEKDRILIKHPELTHYQTDYQDREWLVSQRIISTRNAPTTLLLHEELLKLIETRLEYKNSVKISDLQPFKLPEFIFKKITPSTVDASKNFHLKPPKSSLSSSHATLTALLAKQSDLDDEDT